MYTFITRLFILAGAAVFVMLLETAVPVCLAETVELSPEADAKRAASDLFKQGKFSESYEIFISLFRNDPLNADINLGVARSAYAARRYNQAVMAYERLIDSFPDKAFLLTELAAVYLELGDTERSEAYLEKARIVDPGVDVSLLRERIKRTRASADKFFFGGSVGLGFLYDTNANNGPQSRSVVLGDLKLRLDNEAVRKESPGFTLNGNFNFVWKPDPAGKLSYIANASFFGKAYTESSVNSNSFLWMKVAAGLRYSLRTMYADVRLKSDVIQYASDQNIVSPGAEGSFGWLVLPRVNLTTKADFERRFYNGDTSNDGFVISAGEYASYSFSGGHYVRAGGKFVKREAKSSRMSYLGGEASLGGSVFLFGADYSLDPFFSYRAEWYDAPATALESKNRKDDQYSAGLSVTRYFKNTFSVGAEYRYVYNYSVSPVYRYEQHTVNLRASWYF